MQRLSCYEDTSADVGVIGTSRLGQESVLNAVPGG